MVLSQKLADHCPDPQPFVVIQKHVRTGFYCSCTAIQAGDHDDRDGRIYSPEQPNQRHPVDIGGSVRDDGIELRIARGGRRNLRILTLLHQCLRKLPQQRFDQQESAVGVIINHQELAMSCHGCVRNMKPAAPYCSLRVRRWLTLRST